MVIVFMIRLENYLCHNVFNKKNISTFDVLTLIQLRTDKNKDKYGRTQMRIEYSQNLH